MGDEKKSKYNIPPKKGEIPQDPKVMDSALTVRENMRKQKSNRTLEK